MEKIRVIHHTNDLGLGGTEKTMQLFCKYLDKSVFDVHAMAPKFPVSPLKMRINSIKSLLGNERARERKLRYELNNCRAPDMANLLGEDHLHLYATKQLSEVISGVSPQILHVHHSGEIEAPLDNLQAIANVPLIFTTNIFGMQGRRPEQDRISKILFVSKWLKDVEATWSQNDQRCDVLYNPVEKPGTDSNLRFELGIPEHLFVLGRVGRNADDIHDPISLKAYKEIENANTLFLVLSPPPRMIREAQELGIRNIRFLPPSTDDRYLSSFYNTIDALAHARLDGETFGCVIAEAMIHGKPVITHHSHIRNSQSELVDSDCGFVVEQHDSSAYANCISTLMTNVNLRREMGEAARRKALTQFEASVVTKKLERFYSDALRQRGINL